MRAPTPRRRATARRCVAPVPASPRRVRALRLTRVPCVRATVNVTVNVTVNSMDTVATFEMAKALGKHKMITAVHKHYTVEGLCACVAAAARVVRCGLTVGVRCGGVVHNRVEGFRAKEPGAAAVRVRVVGYE